MHCNKGRLVHKKDAMLSELKTGAIDRWLVISENSETQVEKVSNQPDGLQRGEVCLETGKSQI